MKNTDPAVSVLHITDLHMMPKPGDTLLGVDTEKSFQAVLEKAFSEPDGFDLILVTGDLAQDPSRSGYQKIQSALNALPTPSICLPGNHDDYALMREIFNSGHISCRKQTIVKNWQIICLNSQIQDFPGGHLSVLELNFLDRCLEQNPGKPALIAVHHHCLETYSVWMDTMMIDNSPELISVLDRHPEIKAIICGHIHQVMDRRIGSIRVLGTPSTCFQFTPESRDFSIDDAAPGYRTLKLYADGRIESKVSRLSNKLSGLKIDSDSY
ncbi:MAG: 3',5'-cyclic-AMP phosphodiesterase [Gammaproteobacteria bacterium]